MEHVLSWDENKVTKWMSTIGYSSFEKQFKEQGITGDVLVNLDHESLRDLSILTVGQRMDLLKNIYQLKIHYRVPVNEWDYIPPSVLYETDWLGQNGMADYRKIEAAFQERDARIKRLTEDLSRVNNDMNILREEISHILKLKDKKPHNDMSSSSKSKQAHSHHNNSSSNNNKRTKSPTKPASHSNDHHHNRSNNDTMMVEESKLSTPNVMINDGGAIKVYGDKISKVEHEPESSKNVRLLLDDPTSKVITSALKKYNVVSDWQQYALWIQYGPHDNMQERALGYDERPLRISQKLKEAKQNPVFVLKHVKDNKPFIPPNYSHPRPAPKPQQFSNSNSAANNTKNNNSGSITTGRVGFDVVVPVMSSSISSPTTSQQPQPTLSTSNSTLNLASSSSNLTITNNNNSTTNISTQQQQKRQQPITPPPAPPKKTEYNNELGLDTAVVNAIFSINNGNQNS